MALAGAPFAASAGSADAPRYAQLAPPAAIPDAGDEQSPDAALLLRVERLESDLRRATGEIEELQNENQRLAEELKRFRDDVEFRLSGGKTPLASAPPPAAPQSTSPAPQVRKSDAFDPNAQPNAAGAPHELGTTAPSAPLDLTPKVAEAAPRPARCPRRSRPAVRPSWALASISPMARATSIITP